MAHADAGEVVEPVARLAAAAEGDQHAEGADVHEHVDRQVVEERGAACRGAGDEPEQRVAGVRDARVREHALHAALADRDDVADRHGERREDARAVRSTARPSPRG